MNPFDHARSSARRFGGAWEDYLPLHSWFDASKATHCHFTHRALRHHHEGIAEAVQLFGPTIRNCDGVDIATLALGRQHLEEDCPHIPNAADWVADLRAPEWLGATSIDSAALAIASARRFGGTPGDYQPLHAWFLDTRGWTIGPEHLLFRHHAFGIFAAEQRFGTVIGPGSIPTRVIGEHHVRAVLGRIPAPSDWLRRIKGERWMLQATSPAKLGL